MTSIIEKPQVYSQIPRLTSQPVSLAKDLVQPSDTVLFSTTASKTIYQKIVSVFKNLLAMIGSAFSRLIEKIRGPVAQKVEEAVQPIKKSLKEQLKQEAAEEIRGTVRGKALERMKKRAFKEALLEAPLATPFKKIERQKFVVRLVKTAVPQLWSLLKRPFVG
jgi:hypothetical protein